MGFIINRFISRYTSGMVFSAAFFLSASSVHAQDDINLIDVVEFDLPKSFTAACERDLAPPEIFLRIIDEGHTVSKELSAKDITSVANMTRLKAGARTQDYLSFGITTPRNQIAYKAEGQTLHFDGEENEVSCVSPIINVDIILKRAHIDIAKEVSSGSCAEAVIFTDGLRHVSLNRENMNDMAVSIQNLLLDKLGEEKILYGTEGGISSFLDGELKENVIELFRVNSVMMAARYSRLDTPKNTERLLKACNNELMDLEKKLKRSH